LYRAYAPPTTTSSRTLFTTGKFHLFGTSPTELSVLAVEFSPYQLRGLYIRLLSLRCGVVGLSVWTWWWTL